MSTITTERLPKHEDAELGQAPATVDVDQLIRELDAAYDRFPEAALRACQANRELVTPRLIDVLQHAVRVGQDGAVRVGNAPIYAIFLLTEFEAAESLPVVMDFLKLPHDVPNDLLGESITEDLPRILAILARDRIDLIDELIGDPAVNQFVRWSAADSFVYLVRDGRLSRQDAIERLKADLANEVRRRDWEITGPLIITLLKLNAHEARTEIEEAFRQDLVETFLVTLDCVNDALRPDMPDSCNDLQCRPTTRISDTVEELRNWFWSDDYDTRKTPRLSQDIWPFGDSGPLRSDTLPLTHDELPAMCEPTTIRHDAARVGRNDPCPCGSGKKYKKCCLRAAQEN